MSANQNAQTPRTVQGSKRYQVEADGKPMRIDARGKNEAACCATARLGKGHAFVTVDGVDFQVISHNDELVAIRNAKYLAMLKAVDGGELAIGPLSRIGQVTHAEATAVLSAPDRRRSKDKDESVFIALRAGIHEAVKYVRQNQVTPHIIEALYEDAFFIISACWHAGRALEIEPPRSEAVLLDVVQELQREQGGEPQRVDWDGVQQAIEWRLWKVARHG